MADSFRCDFGKELGMATFYVLPSRQQLGERFNAWLAGLLPGAAWPRGDWPQLAESLVGTLQDRPGVHLVFCEDGDERLPLPAMLARDFGAEPGDEVVEVRLGDAGRDSVALKRSLAA